MRNFQDTFETRNQSFISAFSICMTVPLIPTSKYNIKNTIYNKFFINWHIQKQLDKQGVFNKTNSCKYKKITILTKQ